MSDVHHNLEGKTVLVTGSTRGIGKSIAAHFLQAGATVVVHGRTQKSVDVVCEALQNETGGSVAGYAADFLHPEEVVQLAELIKHNQGRLDILVNNAAVRTFRLLQELEREEWDAAFRVNVTAPLSLVQQLLACMPRGSSVINIASIAAVQTLPASFYYRGAHYIASKGALLALTRALAAELQELGIRVNAIAPGVVQGNEVRPAAEEFARTSTTIGRMLQCDEIAKICLCLASETSSGVTGETIVIGG